MTRRTKPFLAVLAIALGLALAPVQASPVAPAPAQAQAQTAQYGTWPAGGWLPQGAKFIWEHPDQGRDFATTYHGIVQAPGSGCVVAIGADRPFPNGFGPDYPMVSITAGRWAGHTWYLGHTSTLVHEGQCFRFGAPLARADQGTASSISYALFGAPNDGSWVELGEVVQINGNTVLGPYSDTGHWFDSLFSPLVIADPYALYPKVVFSLAFGARASEYNTIKTWDLAGCENRVIRVVCKGTLYHLKLERDRDLWVAKHQLVDGHWANRTRPDYVTNKIGARIKGMQHRITAPPDRRCSVQRCS